MILRRRRRNDARSLQLASFHPRGAALAYVPEHSIPRLPDYALASAGTSKYFAAKDVGPSILQHIGGERRLWLSNIHVSRTNLHDSPQLDISGINASFASEVFRPRPKYSWTAVSLVHSGTIPDAPMTVVSVVWSPHAANPNCHQDPFARTNTQRKMTQTDDDNLPIEDIRSSHADFEEPPFLNSRQTFFPQIMRMPSQNQLV